MFRFRFKWSQVNWPNSKIFLITTFVLTLTAVPVYLWYCGLDAFQLERFVLFAATGLSITLGYHRLFPHRTFQASWPVRFATLVFGAAAFENSVLNWAADHCQHHKHVDHDDDPYDISKGFFHAHIGWILFKLEPITTLDCVKDLQQDKPVMWQHRYYHSIAIFTSFLCPTLILGGLWGGASGTSGGLLIGGVARIVFVQHMTFSSTRWPHCGASDLLEANAPRGTAPSWHFSPSAKGITIFTHEFQHDYRNGVKPWQFDPTKWSIWLLERAGLASQLRRVPEEKIQLAQIAEQQRQLAAALNAKSLPRSMHEMLESVQARLHLAAQNWEQRKADYRHAAEVKMEASRERLAVLRREFHEATERLRTRDSRVGGSPPHGTDGIADGISRRAETSLPLPLGEWVGVRGFPFGGFMEYSDKSS